MRKVIALSGCIILISLAVISQSAAATSAAPASSIDVSPLERAIQERWTGDLDGMARRRLIRVLAVCSKTYYFYDGMQPRGITYEISRALEEAINQKLGTGNLRINVVLVPVARNQLIPALLDGRGDLAAGNLTITPEREKLVDFSEPALEGVMEIVVTGPAAPRITSIDDFAGSEVFVRKSSSFAEHLAQLNAELARVGKKPIVIRPADENLEDEDILAMANAGLVGTTVVDSHVLKHWAPMLGNLTMHPNIGIHSGGKIAWAFRKGSPQLRAALTDFAATHKAGTPFGNTLLRRYWGSDTLVKNATASPEMRKFEALKELFRKYGDQYGLDWLLLAAQGYQESGLNQAARSPKGAVGVMQLLPSTAAAPPVNLPNIRTPENNIHAGAKLLRSFIDENFNDPQLNAFNRGLFAVAAYNAGPTAIADMRKKAQAMGLDPNKWFQNVEVATSRHIGLEPVQYVSNIFKYYIGYRSTLERQREKTAAASPAH
jgi:membrane-bound lytic murein transglycosylase MltF